MVMMYPNEYRAGKSLILFTGLAQLEYKMMDIQRIDDSTIKAGFITVKFHWPKEELMGRGPMPIVDFDHVPMVGVSPGKNYFYDLWCEALKRKESKSD